MNRITFRSILSRQFDGGYKYKRCFYPRATAKVTVCHPSHCGWTHPWQWLWGIKTLYTNLREHDAYSIMKVTLGNCRLFGINSEPPMYPNIWHMRVPRKFKYKWHLYLQATDVQGPSVFRHFTGHAFGPFPLSHKSKSQHPDANTHTPRPQSITAHINLTIRETK